MNRRPRVLLLNNYPMAAALEGWRAGTYPGHHLWGADGLHEHGFEVVIPPFARLPEPPRMLKRRVPAAWGDMDQQLRALVRLDCDVVYSACQYASGFLARMRSRGLFPRPIVALVHHELARDANGLAFVAGHTRLACLSGRVRSQLTDAFSVPAEKVQVLDWGPELRFYDAVPAEDGGGEPIVASVGKSFRDHDTLAAAAEDAPIRTVIVGTPPARAPASARVEVVPVTEAGPHVPYRDVLRLCRRARILAIPLVETNGLAGLTSLVDALGLGKPVIMTRNALVEIDVEAEGIGVWVEPGDVAGWRRAIDELARDDARCREMGRRARALAERRYNTGAFTLQLARLLTSALADRSRIGAR